MNPSRPDAATLDAMALGTVVDDQEPWEWLVSAPKAEAAWAEAVRRRERLDQIAFAIQGRPWLARVVSFVLERRRARSGPSLESFVAVPALEAVLGEADAAAEMVVAEWGAMTPRSVRLGQTLGLRAREPSTDICVFYRVRDRQGALPSKAWTLERGEAPVLLVACLNATDPTSLDRAVATAEAIAGFLILEPEEGETEP